MEPARRLRSEEREGVVTWIDQGHETQSAIEGLEKVLRFTFPTRDEAVPAPPRATLSLSQIEIGRAIELVHEAAETIRAAEERVRDGEARAQAIVTRAAEELKSADGRIQAAEARARAAETRAQELETRLKEAEGWLRQIFATISGGTAGPALTRAAGRAVRACRRS